MLSLYSFWSTSSLWSFPRMRRLCTTRPQFFIITAWWQIKSGRRMVDTMLSSWVTFTNTLCTLLSDCVHYHFVSICQIAHSQKSRWSTSFLLFLSASVFSVDHADAEWNWLLLLLMEVVVVARMTKIYPFVRCWGTILVMQHLLLTLNTAVFLNDINLKEVTTSLSM